MEQEIHFCTTPDGIRIAYATVGLGPPLLFLPLQHSHLELEWEEAERRAFIQRLAANHTVVRYDRWGCGLSDRERSDFSLASEVRVLEGLISHLKVRGADFFGLSQSGPTAMGYAAQHPREVRHLVLCDTFARRVAEDLPLREATNAVILAHWGTGSRMTADRVMPGANAERLEWFARYQREAVTAEMLVALRGFLEAENDIRDICNQIHAPTLVLHRRGDKTVAIERGREVAAAIPGASFVPLEGDDHLPWLGDSELVLRTVEEFLSSGIHRQARGQTDTRRAANLGAGSSISNTAERVLATVLFTDIVGSTEHAAILGDRQWRELKEQHHVTVRREIARYGGHEVDTAGDGFFVTFDRPLQAIRCAWAISRAVQALALQVRAGLHTGEVEVEQGGVAGIAVHIGARVASQAGAGEVLVSSTVKDLVAGVGGEFEDRGTHQLKGVPGDWHLFAVTGSA